MSTRGWRLAAARYGMWGSKPQTVSLSTSTSTLCATSSSSCTPHTSATHHHLTSVPEPLEPPYALSFHLPTVHTPTSVQTSSPLARAFVIHSPMTPALRSPSGSSCSACALTWAVCPSVNRAISEDGAFPPLFFPLECKTLLHHALRHMNLLTISMLQVLPMPWFPLPYLW